MLTNEMTYAFTSKSTSGLSLQLKNEVNIISGGEKMEFVALWDTGATGTCISHDVVKKLHLQPVGKQSIRTPSGFATVNTYLVDIELPNSVVVKEVCVCESEIGSQGIGALIGMDIITKGDFAVSNYNGKTVFSFRVPSETITDYVSQFRAKRIAGSHGRGKRKKK